MTQDEFLEELAIVLNEDMQNVTPDIQVQDLEGWDSTGVLGVVALLDGLLQAPVDVDRLHKCRTVRDLIELVADRLN